MFKLEPLQPTRWPFECDIHARLSLLVNTLAECLGCEPHEVLGDYAGVDPREEHFDRTVFERLERGSYLLGRALFRIQSGLCLTRLRLYHMVQYDNWLDKLTQVMMGSAEALKWINAQTGFPTTPSPPPPLEDGYTYWPTRAQAIDDMIREAGGKATRKLDDAEARISTVERKMKTLARLGTTEARATRLLHGKVELARLCVRFELPEWMRRFIQHDWDNDDPVAFRLQQIKEKKEYEEREAAAAAAAAAACPPDAVCEPSAVAAKTEKPLTASDLAPPPSCVTIVKTGDDAPVDFACYAFDSGDYKDADMAKRLAAANADADFTAIYTSEGDDWKNVSRTHMRAMRESIPLPDAGVELVKPMMSYKLELKHAANHALYQSHNASVRGKILTMDKKVFDECLVLDGGQLVEGGAASKVVDDISRTHGILVGATLLTSSNTSTSEFDCRVAFPEECGAGIALRPEHSNTAKVGSQSGGDYAKVAIGTTKHTHEDVANLDSACWMYNIGHKLDEACEQYRWLQLSRKDFEEAANKLTVRHDILNAEGKKTGVEVDHVQAYYSARPSAANLVSLIAISYAHDVRQRYEEHGFSIEDVRQQLKVTAEDEFFSIRRDVFFMVVDHYLERYSPFAHHVNLSRSYLLLRPSTGRGVAKWAQLAQEERATVNIMVQFDIMPVKTRATLASPEAFAEVVHQILPAYLNDDNRADDRRVIEHSDV